MDVREIKEAEFESVTKDSTVLVDFYASWCGPCKMLAPVLEKVKDTIQIVKVNVDESNTLAMKYGVMSVPTLIIMKDGKIASQTSGFMPEQHLRSWIEENK